MSKPSTARLARLIVGACALTLAMAPAQALAHPHDGHASRARHKKKKVAPALVRCASVTVTCHEHGSAVGPQGPPGPAGASGAAGAAGTGISARIRSTLPVTSATTEVGVPLSPPSIEHVEGQDQQLLGEVTVTLPPGRCSEASSAPEPDEGQLHGGIFIDERPAGVFAFGGAPYTPGAVRTAPVIWLGAGLGLESLAPTFTFGSVEPTTSHALRAVVEDDCTLSGATHFIVDSVAIDVLQDG